MTEHSGRPQSGRRTRRGARRGLVLAAALAVGVGALSACQLPGSTFTVTTTADGVDSAPGDGVCETALGNDVCTLRAAVMEANATPGTNNVELGDGSVYVLTLSGGAEDGSATGDLDITGSVAVNGHSTIDAASIDRVLDVRAETLILDGPTITGGAVSSTPIVGGGIRVAPGASLLVNDATITGNVAERGGGGIDGAGPVTLVDSTVSDNRSDGYVPVEGTWVTANGAGVAVHSASLTVVSSTITDNHITIYGSGGGLFADGTGTVTVERSTIDHNSARAEGGSAVAGPDVTIRSSTIADNSTETAVAAHHLTLSSSTITSVAEPALHADTATLKGTIVTSTVQACYGTITSQGYNLASDASCGLGGPGDQSPANPLLGPLADNGGPTATRSPFANSPVLDAIPVGTPSLCDGSVSTDQRGQARLSGSACDIGAVEGPSSSSATPLDLVVDDAGDAADLVPGDGVCVTAAGTCSLRAAIDETNTWPAPDTATIAPGIDPLHQGTPVFPAIADSLALHGNGATVTAPEPGYSSLMVGSGTVAIDHVHLVGSGGLAINGGDVTVSDSTTTGATDAGIFVRRPASLELVRSTSSGNRVGLAAESTPVSIVQSTLAGNRGPAVQLSSSAGEGSMDVIASTLSGPTDGSAEAVLAQGSTALRLRGSVVANRTGIPACTGSVESDGYNVVGDTSCGTATTGDRFGADPFLLSLASNGGPTPTRRPYANSPAVDAIPGGTAGLCDATLPVDQRGSARPFGTACDAGAVEGPSPVSVTAPLSLTVTSAADARDAAPGNGVCASAAGPCTMRAAVDESNAWPLADTIVVGSGINPTLSIGGQLEDDNAAGDLDVLDSVTINGFGATLDAGHLDRAIERRAGAATINRLTIRGAVDDGTGRTGAVKNLAAGGSLTLFGSTVTDNETMGILNEGALTVRRSSITNSLNGAIISESIQPSVVDQSTISGNSTGVTATGALSIRRSTITGNTGVALATNSYFGGIEVVASTITGASTSPIVATPASGGSTIRFSSTALDNTGGSVCSDAVLSGGYNRVTDTSCQFAQIGDGNVGNLGIGALANNGGPTLTRMPNVGSTLLNTVPTGTVGLCDTTLPFDQRVQPRPQGTGCDIGSVERTP